MKQFITKITEVTKDTYDRDELMAIKLWLVKFYVRKMSLSDQEKQSVDPGNLLCSAVR